MHRVIAIGVAIAALGLAACEKDGREKRLEPVRIAFGDCAGVTVHFESGPRPRPFDLAEVDQNMVSVLSRAKSNRTRLAEAKRQLAALPRPKIEPKPEEPSENDAGSSEPARVAEIRALDPGERMIGGVFGAAEGDVAAITGFGDLSSGLDDVDIYGGLLGDQVSEMQGGFGAGAVSIDWESIGTGRYSSLGVGGGIRGAVVRPGKPKVKGTLDKDVIRRHIRRELAEIRACYEERLRVDSDLEGAVTAKFTIEPTGTVAKLRVKGMDKEVTSCMAEILEKLVLPEPPGKDRVKVRYPFTFRPGGFTPGADESNTPPESGPADAGAAGTEGDGRAELAAKKPVTKPVTPGDRAPAAPVLGAGGGYEPGAQNPLRSHRSALESCFRAADKNYGVMFVEMNVESDGAVSAAQAVGLDAGQTAGKIADKIAECVAAAAGKAVFDEPERATYRCPLAYGEMPTGDATTLDITADTVDLDSVPVASVHTIVDDRTARWRIAPLFERLRLRARIRDLSRGREPMAITGPMLIRPIDKAPMKVVSRVVKNAAASGNANLVFLARDGQLWRSLKVGLIMPVAPVPVSSGGTWFEPKGVGLGGKKEPSAQEKARVSILVTTDELWVGIGPKGDFRKIAVTGREGDRKIAGQTLQRVLTEYKRSADFAERRDIELAGEDEVLYGTVVEVIDVVNQVGFTDWVLTDPGTLAARPNR